MTVGVGIDDSTTRQLCSTLVVVSDTVDSNVGLTVCWCVFNGSITWTRWEALGINDSIAHGSTVANRCLKLGVDEALVEGTPCVTAAEVWMALAVVLDSLYH